MLASNHLLGPVSDILLAFPVNSYDDTLLVGFLNSRLTALVQFALNGRQSYIPLVLNERNKSICGPNMLGVAK